MIIQFQVPGLPQPKGSTTSFVHPRTKRIVTMSANTNLKSWQERAALAASAAMQGNPPTQSAVVVGCEFIFLRPKSHYGTGKNEHRIKDTAPRHHTVKPDTDKLLRAALDAMTHVVYVDDNQVIGFFGMTGKRYATPREPPGAIIRVQFEPSRTVGEWRARLGVDE